MTWLEMAQLLEEHCRDIDPQDHLVMPPVPKGESPRATIERELAAVIPQLDAAILEWSYSLEWPPLKPWEKEILCWRLHRGIDLCLALAHPLSPSTEVPSLTHTIQWLLLETWESLGRRTCVEWHVAAALETPPAS